MAITKELLDTAIDILYPINEKESIEVLVARRDRNGHLNVAAWQELLCMLSWLGFDVSNFRNYVLAELQTQRPDREDIDKCLIVRSLEEKMLLLTHVIEIVGLSTTRQLVGDMRQKLKILALTTDQLPKLDECFRIIMTLDKNNDGQSHTNVPKSSLQFSLTPKDLLAQGIRSAAEVSNFGISTSELQVSKSLLNDLLVMLNKQMHGHQDCSNSSQSLLQSSFTPEDLRLAREITSEAGLASLIQIPSSEISASKSILNAYSVGLEDENLHLLKMVEEMSPLVKQAHDLKALWTMEGFPTLAQLFLDRLADYPGAYDHFLNAGFSDLAHQFGEHARQEARRQQQK